MIDELMKQVEDESRPDTVGCFGRRYGEESSVVMVEELPWDPISYGKGFYQAVAGITDYKPCSKEDDDEEEEDTAMYDVWDLSKQQFLPATPTVECTSESILQASSTDNDDEDQAEYYGLVSANAFKLALFKQPSMPLELDAAFKLASVELFNYAFGNNNNNTSWLGRPHYFLFKLVFEQYYLRRVEVGKGVIPRELRKSAVNDVAQRNQPLTANATAAWTLLYSAPECTLLFPKQKQQPQQRPSEKEENSTLVTTTPEPTKGVTPKRQDGWTCTTSTITSTVVQEPTSDVLSMFD